MMGTLYGAYVAQNYKVPYIKKVANSGLIMGLMAEHMEETYLKPKSKRENVNNFEWFNIDNIQIC